MHEILYYAAVGFAAQMVDGTLGMAYGVSASTLLLGGGMAPAAVSATVHAAEVFTTGASGVSHRLFGNVDEKLFMRLVVPGVIGAVVGAYILASLPGERLKPLIAAYLLFMGLLIVYRALRNMSERVVTTHLVPLGFFGAFVDAIGGGGWGPVVTSTLVARGNPIRSTVGTVNAVEFFVTAAASVTFIMMLGVGFWKVIVGLALGGLLAAPLAALACKRLPLRPLMFVVGVLVAVLSMRTLMSSML
jgi:uncharacterized membrane protein YfcA